MDHMISGEAELARRSFLAMLGLGTAAAFMPAPSWAFAAEDYPTILKELQAIVTSRKAANALAAIGRGLDPLDVLSAGTLALDSKTPVDIDTLFRVYSMTKPITGMAAMMLVGEGKIKLDQPIADFLPEFAKMTVLTDPANSMDAVPAKTQITLRHLLTHTAGFGYSIVTKGPLLKAYLDNGITPGVITRLKIPGAPLSAPVPDIDTFSKRLGTLPLIAEPGTKWSYSVSLDLTGRLIQAVSGIEFETFLQQRIFGPLKMTSSFFQLPQSEIGRTVTNYTDLNGFLFPIDPPTTSIYLDKPAFAFGGAGLICSTRDYDRFLTMLLNDGVLDGVRVMTPEMVALGASNLLPAGVKFEDGSAGYGAGGRVGLGERAGEYGWGGAAGTVGAVDRVRKFRMTGMTQVFGADNGFLRDGLAKWLLQDLAR